MTTAIGSSRHGGSVRIYHLSYAYGHVGNHLTKTDRHSAPSTVYHYDVETPATYLTRDNRLMDYGVFDDNDSESVLVERVDYECLAAYTLDVAAQPIEDPRRCMRRRSEIILQTGS